MGTSGQAAATTVTGAAPDEPVPVAVIARTSTLTLQDPVASLNRQIRSCRAWLPPGWTITAFYWDIESGGIDLEDRSQGDAYKQFTALGIPRDGGMAELLAEASSPHPQFAAVVCEDIERSGRDTFNALKLEKELSRQGIPLFATDEPADIAGVNATTVLVRRVKQGVAEWFRLQLKEKAWKGLVEHSLAGWNIGPAPYGYQGDRVPHPAPAKAAQGRTKTRLTLDPVTGPVVTQIYQWRVTGRLGIPTITARLNADPAAYPPPSDAGWNRTTVTAILANPKYTGHMVFGRERTRNGQTRKLPQDQWIWSPEPVHPALTDRTVWEAAQVIGAERGNIRDPEMPTSQPGRRYLLRSRIRCRICQRRMCGITRTSAGRSYSYYLCPHAQSRPGYAAAPEHGAVSVREDAMTAAIAGFLDQQVFGHDRAALLAAQLPASTAEQATRQAAQAAQLRSHLALIETAERSLITELEQPGDPADPATQAYRARIRERYAERYQERTSTETKLAALEATAPQATDASLLDELPYAAGLLTSAPDHIKQAIYQAFDIQALYNKADHQVTIWATITDATPQTIQNLLTDPRTNHDTQAPAPGPETTAPATFSELARSSDLAQDPICPLTLHLTRHRVWHEADVTPDASEAKRRHARNQSTKKPMRPNRG